MTKQHIDLTEDDMITLLHALDTTMQIAQALNRREDWIAARALAIRLSECLLAVHRERTAGNTPAPQKEKLH